MTDCDALILSDLHLGSRAARPRRLRRFLHELIGDRQPWRPARLILAGDVFDSLDFRRWSASHWRALDALRAVADRITTAWAVGNHDGPVAAVAALAGPAVEVGRAVRFAAGGWSCVVAHGHDLPIPTAADPPAAVAAALQAVHHYARRKDLREAVTVARGAAALARAGGQDAAVCGHTHAPFCGRVGGIAYANGGGWTDDLAGYVVARGGTLSVHDYR